MHTCRASPASLRRCTRRLFHGHRCDFLTLKWNQCHVKYHSKTWWVWERPCPELWSILLFIIGPLSPFSRPPFSKTPGTIKGTQGPKLLIKLVNKNLNHISVQRNLLFRATERDIAPGATTTPKWASRSQNDYMKPRAALARHR